jgi:hypothetical protein
MIVLQLIIMTEKAGKKDFQFIAFNGSQVGEDPRVRTTIRKQAMKGVGAAQKKVGNRALVNVGQFPLSGKSPGALEEFSRIRPRGIRDSADLGSKTSPRSLLLLAAGTATEMTASKGLVRIDPDRASPLLAHVGLLRTQSSIPAAIPTSGYEALRAKYYFDVSDLGPLTAFSVSRSTVSAIANNPKLLDTLFGYQNASYLNHVPARYGHKPYLDAVVDCVAAMARSALSPSNNEFGKEVLKMYAKALRAISIAVSDEKSSRDADLLCAVQLLSLYEV